MDIAHYRLVNLIEQYFEPVKKTKLSEYENPQPLRFEELHENMWVWDNHWKLYIQIQNLNENAFQGYEYYAEFEENRFYRRQVE